MKTGRNSSLEGLRGFAAIMVFLNHFCAMFYPAFILNEGITHCNNIDYQLGQTPLQLLANGNTGVVFFLLLTGYGSYQVYRRGFEAIKKYVVLRYFKLLLLVIVSSIGIFLCASQGLVFYSQAATITKTNWLGDYSPENLNYVDALFNNPLVALSKYNTALWTMKYMFIGAGISILFSLILTKVKKRWLYVLLAFLVFWNLNESYYICCVLGVLVAVNENESSYIDEHKGMECLFLIIGIYLAAFPTFIRPTSFWYCYFPWSAQATIYYHFIGSFFIMIIIVQGHMLERVLNLKIFQFLGKYSSAIYASHIGILVSFSSYLFTYLFNIKKISYCLSTVIVFLSTFIAVLLFSILISFILKFLYKGLDHLYLTLG